MTAHATTQQVRHSRWTLTVVEAIDVGTSLGVAAQLFGEGGREQQQRRVRCPGADRSPSPFEGEQVPMVDGLAGLRLADGRDSSFGGWRGGEVRGIS